jgi:hypothetical protein
MFNIRVVMFGYWIINWIRIINVIQVDRARFDDQIIIDGIDQGKEFMGAFAEMVSQDYGIKRQGITIRNPQANAVIERIHQTIASMIRMFEVQDEPY